MEYKKREYYLFKILYFIRFFADAMFYNYTTLYLSSLGFQEGIIGTITSITTITALIAGPIWSIFAKNNKIIRILLCLLSAVEGIGIILYGNLGAVEGIMLVTALLAIAASPYYNMLDGYAQGYCETYGKDYSKIRLMGSLSYMLAVLLCSFILERIGFRMTFMISGSIFIIVGLLSFILPKTERKVVLKKREYKKILKNPSYILYMITYLLTISLCNVIDGYNSIFFTKEQGLTVSQYSFVSVGFLVAEITSLFLAGKLIKKANYSLIFVIVGILLGIKTILMSFTSLPIGWLIAFATLRGVAWGLFLFVHIKNLSKLVGLENVTTAAILISTFGALFSFVLNNVSGYAIEGIGYSRVYRIGGAIMLIASMAYGIFSYISKKIALPNQTNSQKMNEKE